MSDPADRAPLWPPPPSALLAVSAVLLVLTVVLAVQGIGAGGRADRAEQAAADAEARAEELADTVADLRRELQTRQGELADLQDQLAAVPSPDPTVAPTPTPTATPTPTPEPASDQDPAAVAALVAGTPGVTRAVHVTTVVDGDTLLGFDLTAALAGDPEAPTVQVELSGILAPSPGDCRHTQSTTLVEAWLAATDHDVLLRPAGEDGSPAEVLAIVDPGSSLNVTLVVAGEAIIDDTSVAADLDLAERLQVAEQSAEAAARGVWGCARSALLGTAPAPTPTASPSPTPTPSPTQTP